MRRLLPLLPLVAIAACVRAPEAPQPTPAPPRTAPAPAPAPIAADWRDWPATPGTWRYTRDARGSRAMFGTTGTDARVVLRCDSAARAIYLSRDGTATTPFTIRTSSVTRALPAAPAGGTPPYAAVALAPRDPLLDALAFSRGRFVIEQPGAPALVLPAWAEVGRVVEDCRG